MHPWTARYDPHVPTTLSPYPDRTLVDYLRDSASAAPGEPALFFKGGRLSFRELDTLSDRFAAALGSFGVQRGDRVALVLPNCPQFLIAELGVWKAGGTVLPLNPMYTTPELAEPLRSSGAGIAVTLTPFYQRVKEAQSQAAIRKVIATNIEESRPPAMGWLVTLFKEKKAGHRIQLQPGDAWFQDCLKTAVEPAFRPAPRPDDNAVMLLSGGTTGTPKAVVGKHRDLVAAGLQLRAWLAPVSATADIALLPLPLFHVYACAGVQSHALVSPTPLALGANPRDLGDL